MTEFGEELHRLLEECGLSLREAARRVGCSPGYLSNAAHGRKPLTPSVATRLDQVLGTGDLFAAYALKAPSASNSTGERPASSKPMATRHPGQVLMLPVVIRGRSVLLPVDAATAGTIGLDSMGGELAGEDRAETSVPAYVLPTQDPDELEHIGAALGNARHYLDGSVVEYFRSQLDSCKTEDGSCGPTRALPLGRAVTAGRRLLPRPAGSSLGTLG